MRDLLHWLLANGIGQNVTASILLGTPTIVLGWRKHKQHLQRLHDRLARHERRMAEIHTALVNAAPTPGAPPSEAS